MKGKSDSAPYIPYWPTEDEPPMMKMGLSLNIVAPAGSQKGGRSRLIPVARGSVEYMPSITVVTPRGTVAA